MHRKVDIEDEMAKGTLCRHTLQVVYRSLRHDHPESALVIADALCTRAPHDWAKKHSDSYSTKIAFIKALRNEFDVTLKESKKIIDKVTDE